MFFMISKTFWLIVSPTTLLMVCGLIGVGLLALTTWRRMATGFMVTSILGFMAFGASPLPFLILRPLEDRFPQLELADTAKVDGVIVLGGAIGYARDRIKFNEAGARMTETLVLARRFPQARIVFAGGLGMLVSNGIRTESDATRRLFGELGFAGERFIYEDRSRNTYENALYTQELIKPKPGERWLIVTSAYHMPRAMGAFRAVGMNPIAYPVDYESEGKAGDYRPRIGGFAHGLRFSTLATKEWIGLLAYRVRGYSRSLFPGPE
jgi:uncharacterized SAM-binding protein YcdF (DUF218 family)